MHHERRLLARVDRVFGLDRVAQAHAHLENGQLDGAVLLDIGQMACA